MEGACDSPTFSNVNPGITTMQYNTIEISNIPVGLYSKKGRIY